MKMAIGADHGGFELKELLKKQLAERKIEVEDVGTFSMESTDYPDQARAVAERVVAGRADQGLLVCTTGIGMSIAANRHRGIRAAVCATADMARLSREHNDANVICLGRRILSLDACLELLNIWLDTPFSGGERHCRRVEKLG